MEVEMFKKRVPLWREAHFQVKMYKAHHARTTFGSWDVKKVHAAKHILMSNVLKTQSTFGSWDVQTVNAVVAQD